MHRATGMADPPRYRLCGSSPSLRLAGAPDPQKRPEAQSVLAKFAARKFKPESYTLYSYAALEIIAKAAASAKSLDPRLVAAEMHKGAPYKTVIGDIAYDAKGDITRLDYVVYSWVKGADGKIAYIQQ